MIAVIVNCGAQAIDVWIHEFCLLLAILAILLFLFFILLVLFIIFVLFVFLFFFLLFVFFFLSSDSTVFICSRSGSAWSVGSASTRGDRMCVTILFLLLRLLQLLGLLSAAGLLATLLGAADPRGTLAVPRADEREGDDDLVHRRGVALDKQPGAVPAEDGHGSCPVLLAQLPVDVGVSHLLDFRGALGGGHPDLESGQLVLVARRLNSNQESQRQVYKDIDRRLLATLQVEIHRRPPFDSRFDKSSGARLQK
mmetsp:Transcript_13563/g.36044  ORF Transcript_13563/g.36044 Transcript_13563/m.36044 type:complete len:253 (+) Transcript_13563:158-916(+)